MIQIQQERISRKWILTKWNSILKRESVREPTLDLTYEHGIPETTGLWNSTQGQKLASLHPCCTYLAGYVEIYCDLSKDGLTWKLCSGTQWDTLLHSSFRVACWCHYWKVTIIQISLYFFPLRCWSEMIPTFLRGSGNRTLDSHSVPLCYLQKTCTLAYEIIELVVVITKWSCLDGEVKKSCQQQR